MKPEQTHWLDALIRRTRPVHVSAPTSDVGSRHAAAVVDLALRAAELAVQSGAVTSEATSVALTICSAYGLVADVDITWTSVTISYHRLGRAEPITGFRRVRERDTNYTLLTQLMRFMDDVGTGDLPLEEAAARLDTIRRTLRPYRGWVLCLGQAAVGTGVAAILGGRPLEMVLAALANAMLYMVNRILLRTQLSVFFIQAAAAAVPTAFAIWIMNVRAGDWTVFSEVSPSLIVASGIVSLLAGIGYVAAARDAMDGNLLTGTARAVDAILQTSGIVVGVIVTLWVGFKLGVQGYIAPTSGYASPSLWQVLWACLIGVGVGLGFHLGPRSIPWAALLAAVGFGVYQYSLPLVGNWSAAASLGAVVVGFGGQIITGTKRIPLIALITTGIVAMMPGSALYRGLYEAIRSIGEPLSVQAQINLGEATMIALALAAGSTLGAQLARPLGLPTSALYRAAVERTARRPRRPGGAQ